MPEENTTEAILHEILARQQIHDAVMRYARGVDRLDRDLILSSYHADAIDDHGAFRGSADELADWILERHVGKIPSCTHFIGNSLIRVDGDVACGEIYSSVVYRVASEEGMKDMMAFGRYLDRFERRDGEWKIAERKVLSEMDRIDSVNEESPSISYGVQGTRDKRDPSYAHLLTTPSLAVGVEAIVEEALARQQIHEALLRVSRGADRADKELIVSAFHPDAKADYGAFTGTREELAVWLVDQKTAEALTSVHFLGNELVHVAGDAARSETYFLRTQRFMHEGKLADVVELGRYLDRFEKRDGSWKIVGRTALHDKDRVDAVEEQWTGSLTDAATKGSRSRNDGSYAHFERR